MVWVNFHAKVYQCAGTRFYGTKNGKDTTEADATAMGAGPDHGIEYCGTTRNGVYTQYVS